MNDDSPAEVSMREAENLAIKISSNLPDLVNRYISVRAQRLAIDKEAASLKEHEDELKKLLVSKFREGNMLVVGSTNGTVKMTPGTEPVCNDWPAFYSYIKEHDAWEMLHKRVTITAVKELLDVGETIPGITLVDTFKLTVSGPPK